MTRDASPRRDVVVGATEEGDTTRGEGASDTRFADGREVDADAGESATEALGAEEKEPPIPWASLLTLGLSLLVSALSVTVLFPFLGPLVEWMGAAKTVEQRGLYSGILASGFMVGRAVAAASWGVVADTVGRRVVIVVSLASTVPAMVIFGSFRSYPAAVTVRVLTGILNGVVATAKAMAGELVAPSQAGLGMSVVTSAWGVGLIVGPALGGFFAEPATKWPETFPPDGVFGHYPYVLPCLIVASLAAVGLVFTFLFLPETLPNPEPVSVFLGRMVECVRSCGKGGKGSGEGGGAEEEEDDDKLLGEEKNTDFSARLDSEAGAGDGGEVELASREATKPTPQFPASMSSLGAAAPPAPLPVEGKDNGNSGVWSRKSTMTVIIIYAILSGGQNLMDECIPLWMLTPVSAGGVSLNLSEVGIALTAAGCSLLVFQLLVYPRLSRRIPPLRMMWMSIFAQVPFILAMPLATLVPERSPWVWPVIMVVLIPKIFASTAMFISTALVLNNSVPTELRGRANGLGMMFGSAGKALGPLIGGAVLTWALESFRSALPVWVLASMLLAGGGVAAYCLPDSLNSPAPTTQPKPSSTTPHT